MVGGYAGKFLEADLTQEKLKDITFPEQVLRDYLGGRALGAKILWDRLGKNWEKIDPLGPENIFLALTDPNRILSRNVDSSPGSHPQQRNSDPRSREF
jgi:aldehyde:ferredoxin oxidoreductase